MAHVKLEEGTEFLPVVEHGAVNEARLVVGEFLDILIVCGDDPEAAGTAELAQYGLGEGGAYLRLGTGAYLVGENEGIGIATPQEVLHVAQVRGIGGEVVLYALLVADVDEDVPEH